MNREKLDLWLREISTPTGLSYSGDRTLSNSEVDTILEYVDNLQSKIDKANEILDKLCVMKPWNDTQDEMRKIYRPIKNTSKQEVYKAICDLRDVLKEDK